MNVCESVDNSFSSCPLFVYSYYLRQDARYAIVAVCLSVILSVSRITANVISRFN